MLSRPAVPGRPKLELPPRPPPEVFATFPPAAVQYIEALEAVLQQALCLIAEQAKRLDQLEQELRASQRQATPFRRRKRKDKRKHKRPGRKAGHEAERRAEPEQVDEEHEGDHPASCPCCGGAVETVGSYEQTQEDVVTAKVTRRITIYVGECAECGQRVEGRHPFQTSTARGAAATQIGPKALALSADLHYLQGVPFDKVREHLEHLGLGVSTSAIVRAMNRLAKRGEATFEALLELVLSQEVLHIDETGWSIEGEPCVLWVLSGAEATVYFVRQTKSSDEVADFLADFAGVLMTDGAKAYDKLGKKLLRALCLLHLRRNAKSLEEKQTGGAVCVPRALVDWLDRTIELVGERADLPRKDYERRAAELEREFQETFVGCQPTNEANRRMVERLVTWQDAILRCLRDRRVPATNNHAEGKLRPAVVTRKRGGCNRSPRGARTYEVLTSLAVTARQRGVSFVEWVERLLRQPEPLASAPFW